MLFSITHITRLDYSHSISESVMEVRATPRTDERQVLRQFDFTVTPGAQASCHTDWLGNRVHQFSVLGVHEFVEVNAQCIVETRPMRWDLSQLVAPLDGLIRDHRSWDFLQQHGPVVDDPSIPLLVEQLGLAEVRRVGRALEVVLARTREIISYRKGVTHSASTLREVLEVGAGVCQDYAHLALALLRRIGVPCRYVSGYLLREAAAELETHAWVEAFVPGYGWIGLDPTHGTMATEQYVTVAVGRSYVDVPPNRGVYRGKASEKIRATVTMQPIEERARLTPYSTALERPRKRTSSAPARLPQESRFGLEHQHQQIHPDAVGFVVQQQRQQQQ